MKKSIVIVFFVTVLVSGLIAGVMEDYISSYQWELHFSDTEDGSAYEWYKEFYITIDGVIRNRNGAYIGEWTSISSTVMIFEFYCDSKYITANIDFVNGSTILFGTGDRQNPAKKIKTLLVRLYAL